MTLKEFKQIHGIDKLNFYRSTHSTRFVASFGDNKLLITTEEFDPKGKMFVYDNPATEGGASWILSNKQPKEADFTL